MPSQAAGPDALQQDDSKRNERHRLTGLDSLAYSYRMALSFHLVPSGASFISSPAGGWLDPTSLYSFHSQGQLDDGHVCSDAGTNR